MWTTNKLGLSKLALLITYKLLLRQWQCIAAPQKLIVNIKNDLGTCEQKALCPPGCLQCLRSENFLTLSRLR